MATYTAAKGGKGGTTKENTGSGKKRLIQDNAEKGQNGFVIIETNKGTTILEYGIFVRG